MLHVSENLRTGNIDFKTPPVPQRYYVAHDPPLRRFSISRTQEAPRPGATCSRSPAGVFGSRMTLGNCSILRDLKYKLVSCGPRRTRFRSITPLSAICCKLCLMVAGDHMFSSFQSNNPGAAFSSPIGTSSSRSLAIAIGISSTNEIGYEKDRLNQCPFDLSQPGAGLCTLDSFPLRLQPSLGMVPSCE